MGLRSAVLCFFVHAVVPLWVVLCYSCAVFWYCAVVINPENGCRVVPVLYCVPRSREMADIWETQVAVYPPKPYCHTFVSNFRVFQTSAISYVQLRKMAIILISTGFYRNAFHLIDELLMKLDFCSFCIRFMYHSVLSSARLLCLVFCSVDVAMLCLMWYSFSCFRRVWPAVYSILVFAGRTWSV